MKNRPYRSDRVPTNPENWSDESKRSGIFESPPAEYKDNHFLCWRCKQPSVFTAEAQRQTYEVRKAYIWQRRVLCEDCFRINMQLEAQLKDCACQWQQSSATLKNNPNFLHRWLNLLEDNARYRVHADEGNLNMLRRLLAKHENTEKRGEP